MTPDAQPLPALLLLLFGAAFTTQLARQLMHETPPRPRRLIATATAAGIASVATCALLLEWFTLSHVTLTALSCVVGWSGAGILSRLASALETRLGMHLHQLEDPDHKGGR